MSCSFLANSDKWEIFVMKTINSFDCFLKGLHFSKCVNSIRNHCCNNMNKCPFHTQKAVAAPADWWPDQLNFTALSKDPPGSKTVSKSYAEEIATLDLPGLKADLMKLMTTSHDWYTLLATKNSRSWLLQIVTLRKDRGP